MKKCSILGILAVFLGMGSLFELQAAPSIKLLYSGVVNDTIPDAHGCSGLAVAPNGDYLVTFGDVGDGGPGCAFYLVRSKDQGRTWGPPEMKVLPEKKNEAVNGAVFTAPDGRLFMEKTYTIYDKFYENDPARSVYESNRDNRVELCTSADNGRTWETLTTLQKPAGCLTGTMPGITVLPNGDWAFLCYTVPYAKNDPAFPYGSGFYRSTDQGKTWGTFERVFTEVPGGKRVGYNESAFAVRDDGKIIALARMDTREMRKCTHFWCESMDNGRTWTMPADSGRVCGDFPRVVKLDDNQGFLMVCGYRAAQPVLGTVTFFHSRDGIQWSQIGQAFYQPDNSHIPMNCATGGCQSIIRGPGKNQFYLVFYAHDPKLAGRNKLRVEGNMIEFLP